MKIHIQCPACGNVMIIDKKELQIYHTQPPCQWFELQSIMCHILNKVSQDTMQPNKALN